MIRCRSWFGGVVVAVAFLATTVLAQEGASAESTEPSFRWFDQFVVSGGWITYFLLVMSVVSIALMIEHGLTIRRKTIVAPESAEHIRRLMDQKKYVETLHYTTEDPSMLSYVINAGLLEASNGFAAMERAVEEALEDRSARLLRKIEYLHIIGNISPMIGLFGTIYGMILLFASIREAGGIPGPEIIADNLSVALDTTFWGLVVAIPSLSAFGLLRNRIDVLCAECALTADRLLRVFKPGSAPGVPAMSGAP